MSRALLRKGRELRSQTQNGAPALKALVEFRALRSALAPGGELMHLKGYCVDGATLRTARPISFPAPRAARAAVV